MQFHEVFSLYTIWICCLNSSVSFIKIMWYKLIMRSSRMLMFSFLVLFFIFFNNLDSTSKIRWIFSDQWWIFKSNWLKYCKTHTNYKLSLSVEVVVVRCVCCAMKIVTLWSIKMTVLFKTDSIRCLVLQIIYIKLTVFVFIDQ